MKRIIVIAGILCILLSGCTGFQAIDELYELPEAPAEYVNLQGSIKEVQLRYQEKFGSVEFSTPLSGDFTQTVQVQDLDGDGTEEAIAFFRVNSPEKPLHICIFKQENGAYSLAGTITGDGNAVSSVAYCDLSGDGIQELVVSWQLSNDVRTLGVYNYKNIDAEPLLYTSYDQYLIDEKEQEKPELYLLEFEQDKGVINDYKYDRDSGLLQIDCNAAVSKTVVSCYEMRLNDFANGACGLYVTGIQEDGAFITDLFVHDENRLVNMSAAPTTGVSTGNVSKEQIGLKDINFDGVLEIPVSVQMKKESDNGSINYFVNWSQYSASGWRTIVSSTMYNEAEGWYLEVPESWLSNVYVTQTSNATLGTRSTVFMYFDGEDSVGFLTIYRLTGSNSEERASSGERFILQKSNSTIYAAELSGSWDCGMTQEEILKCFHLISSVR